MSTLLKLQRHSFLIIGNVKKKILRLKVIFREHSNVDRDLFFDLNWQEDLLFNLRKFTPFKSIKLILVSIQSLKEIFWNLELKSSFNSSIGVTDIKGGQIINTKFVILGQIDASIIVLRLDKKDKFYIVNIIHNFGLYFNLINIMKLIRKSISINIYVGSNRDIFHFELNTRLEFISKTYMVRSTKVHQMPIIDFLFFDSNTLISCSFDGTFCTWDGKTLKKKENPLVISYIQLSLQKFHGRFPIVHGLCFSPDKLHLAMLHPSQKIIRTKSIKTLHYLYFYPVYSCQSNAVRLMKEKIFKINNSFNVRFSWFSYTIFRTFNILCQNKLFKQIKEIEIQCFSKVSDFIKYFSEVYKIRFCSFIVYYFLKKQAKLSIFKSNLFSLIERNDILLKLLSIIKGNFLHLLKKNLPYISHSQQLKIFNFFWFKVAKNFIYRKKFNEKTICHNTKTRLNNVSFVVKLIKPVNRCIFCKNKFVFQSEVLFMNCKKGHLLQRCPYSLHFIRFENQYLTCWISCPLIFTNNLESLFDTLYSYSCPKCNCLSLQTI